MRSIFGISIPPRAAGPPPSSTDVPEPLPLPAPLPQILILARAIVEEAGSYGEASIPLSTSVLTADERSPERMSALKTGPSWEWSSPTSRDVIFRTLMLELSASFKIHGTIVFTPLPKAAAPKSTQISWCHFRRASCGMGDLTFSIKAMARPDTVLGARTMQREVRRGGATVTYLRSAIFSMHSATASRQIQFSGGRLAVA
mmetsp:Transcript_15049/g.43504  ORF Transcript_15049/g.43504 Transcript_15049/m.43504 type:complete len:201 (-) Transcript_15049:1234-1836(-)